jgi:hypothetical protein
MRLMAHHHENGWKTVVAVSDPTYFKTFQIWDPCVMNVLKRFHILSGLMIFDRHTVKQVFFLCIGIHCGSSLRIAVDF